MDSIFDQRDVHALRAYLQMASRHKRFDVARAEVLANAAIRYYKGDAAARASLSAGQELERRWYESLEKGEPDYSVYDDEFFVSDVWACWVVYSYKYLIALRDKGDALWEWFGEVASVADLGCGVGWTTAAMKEIFPAAAVHGTQMEGTFQFKVAEDLGRDRGFSVHPAIQPGTDLVFASEYFEHFERPVEHLLDVIRIGNPRCFVIANSFGSRSIGHFDVYVVDGERVSNKIVGCRFNATLRASGYEAVKTGFWNNRPSVWRRRGVSPGNVTT